MSISTRRLYHEDDYLFECDAIVAAIRDGALAFDRTCFYPGGGGQPSDSGLVTFDSGLQAEIAAASSDADGLIWHASSAATALGDRAHLALDAARRMAFMRYHTVLHVLNTITLREYGGWITGAQIGVEYSRIDFKIETLTAQVRDALERRVNEVLSSRSTLRSYTIAEDEFRARPELLRTLEAQPPVVDGKVRVVEIEGFDAQACGGTHVHSTAQVGEFSITRTENKGRINKRFYVKLA